MNYISRRPLVYLLPLVHLCACIAIKVADFKSGVHYLIYVDFPLSPLLVMLGWPRDNFLLWFSTLGTLWWYLLSFAAQRMLGAYAAGRTH
jgi:hypothetical protein